MAVNYFFINCLKYNAMARLITPAIKTPLNLINNLSLNIE